MTKEPVGWTLSPENIENVRKAADADSRSMSQWVDILLTNHFAKNQAQDA